MNYLRRSTLFLIALLMAVNVVAMLMVVVVSTRGIDRISLAEDREIRVAMALIEDVYQLKVAMERQVVGLRGFAATGQAELLQPWEEGVQDFQKVVAELESQPGNAESRRLLAEVKAIEMSHRQYGERLIAFKRAGRDREVQELLRRGGIALKFQAVATIDALIAAQRRQIDRIHQGVNNVEDQVRLQLYVGTLISLPIILLLAASIAWRVIGPLRDLAAASRAIAVGELHVRVNKRFDDEFGAVATAFNTMVEEVERTLKSLQRGNEELRLASQYKDDFLSMVTHEIKTPLTAISGFARMLERGRNGPLNDEQRQSVAKILSNTTRLLEMVNDLLDSTIIRQGKLELMIMPTPYATLVDEVVSQMQAIAHQKGIRLTVDAPANVVLGIDADRIAQVLVNFLSNALKFTPDGGTIQVRTVVAGDRVVTEVEDTGPGISPDEISRLFVPFVTLGHAASGTGLGLSISRAIIEAHGGAIGARSTPGSGSVFYFTLPRVLPA